MSEATERVQEEANSVISTGAISLAWHERRTHKKWFLSATGLNELIQLVERVGEVTAFIFAGETKKAAIVWKFMLIFLMKTKPDILRLLSCLCVSAVISGVDILDWGRALSSLSLSCYLSLYVNTARLFTHGLRLFLTQNYPVSIRWYICCPFSSLRGYNLLTETWSRDPSCWKNVGLDTRPNRGKISAYDTYPFYIFRLLSCFCVKRQTKEV